MAWTQITEPDECDIASAEHAKEKSEEDTYIIMSHLCNIEKLLTQLLEKCNSKRDDSEEEEIIAYHERKS